MLFRVTYNKTGFLNKRKHNMASHSLSLQYLCYYDQLKSAILYLSFVPDPFSRRNRKEWGHDDMKEV